MLKSLSWIAVVLWMILIFYFSQQPVHISNNLSTTITEQHIKTVQSVIPVEIVPGRGGQFKDILIDCTGAAIGIGAATLLSLIGKRRKVLSKSIFEK